MLPKFRINRITGFEIVRGGPKFYTDTHTHTEAYFISLVFLRKCRNKTKNIGINEILMYKEQMENS